MQAQRASRRGQRRSRYEWTLRERGGCDLGQHGQPITKEAGAENGSKQCYQPIALPTSTARRAHVLAPAGVDLSHRLQKMRRTHTLLWVFVLATLASLCAGAGSTASQALLLQALAHLDDEQLVALNRTMAVAVAARRASAAAPPALREAARAAVRRQLLQVIDVKSHSPTYAPTQSGVFEGGDQAIPELEVRRRGRRRSASRPPCDRSPACCASRCPPSPPLSAACAIPRLAQGYMPPLGYEQMSPECNVRAVAAVFTGASR